MDGIKLVDGSLRARRVSLLTFPGSNLARGLAIISSAVLKPGPSTIISPPPCSTQFATRSTESAVMLVGS